MKHRPSSTSKEHIQAVREDHGLRDKSKIILAAELQRKKEALAIRLFRGEPMVREIARTEALYRNDRVGSTQSGRTTLTRAVNRLATQVAIYAASEDTDRPAFVLHCTSAHEWMGLKAPSYHWAIDALDNVNLLAPIDD